MAELLEKELRKPGYEPRTLALGSNTDPYQPVERTLKLTRSVLEVLDRYNHPVGIVTKSSGVLRDLDILSSMAKRNLARVHMSITTLDARLARVMEPRAATPARRLHAIAELTRAGVPAGVLAAPMIPALNDAEMEKILEASAQAGARHAGYVLLRLPLELRQMFEEWLHTHFPDRARHVLSLIRQTRGGQSERPALPPPLLRPGRLCRPAVAPLHPRGAAVRLRRGAHATGLRPVRRSRPSDRRPCQARCHYSDRPPEVDTIRNQRMTAVD